ncbi:MAG TPA: DUF4112 domain-containing protein [Gemmatimonadales bacterium]|nr:DUF4112 domain-containing protein [Gemmatimonadales bacterium]
MPNDPLPRRGARDAAREIGELERRLDPVAPTPGEAHLGRYRSLAWLLDESIKLPFLPFRIGLDAIVGLVPGVGDIVVGGVGAYALFVAYRLGAPPAVLARMVGNVGIDTLVGSIPLLGDLFDAGFKANTRNRRLLDRWIEQPGRTSRRSALVLAASLVVLLAIVGTSLWLAVLAVRAILGAL